MDMDACCYVKALCFFWVWTRFNFCRNCCGNRGLSAAFAFSFYIFLLVVLPCRTASQKIKGDTLPAMLPVSQTRDAWYQFLWPRVLIVNSCKHFTFCMKKFIRLKVWTRFKFCRQAFLVGSTNRHARSICKRASDADIVLMRVGICIRLFKFAGSAPLLLRGDAQGLRASMPQRVAYCAFWFR